MKVRVAKPKRIDTLRTAIPDDALCVTHKAGANRLVLGWREWVGLPRLGIDAIKAKIDTGAKTSSLHAYETETFMRDDERWVRFTVHPHQGRKGAEVRCEAPVWDQRSVTDSGGHREMRYFVSTFVKSGGFEWHIVLSLTNRRDMRFRMLLGREALEGLFLVDPQASYLMGRHKALA